MQMTMSTMPIFTNQELDLFKRIARAVIPASLDKGLPAADDEKIFARLLVYTEEQSEQLKRELDELLAIEGGISTFCDTVETRFDAWIACWAEKWPNQTHGFFRRFVPLVLRAYYQDARVHSAYDRRPGPPFPDGYEIIEGNWSLLDPVRGRPPLYRRY